MGLFSLWKFKLNTKVFSQLATFFGVLWTAWSYSIRHIYDLVCIFSVIEVAFQTQSQHFVKGTGGKSSPVVPQIQQHSFIIIHTFYSVTSISLKHLTLFNTLKLRSKRSLAQWCHCCTVAYTHEPATAVKTKAPAVHVVSLIFRCGCKVSSSVTLITLSLKVVR